MLKELGVGILVTLLLACGQAGATPLDLQYRPATDNPQPGSQTPATQAGPRLVLARSREQTGAMVDHQNGAENQSGWQWLSPSISLSAKHDERNSPEAARIAQQEMDHQMLLEHHDPLLNDLPPALQTLPITVNVGVKYHF